MKNEKMSSNFELTGRENLKSQACLGVGLDLHQSTTMWCHQSNRWMEWDIDSLGRTYNCVLSGQHGVCDMGCQVIYMFMPFHPSKSKKWNHVCIHPQEELPVKPTKIGKGKTRFLFRRMVSMTSGIVRYSLKDIKYLIA